MQKYKLVKEIGVGETSTVNLAVRDGADEFAALKIIQKVPGRDMNSFHWEAVLQSQLHHAHIAQLSEVIDTPQHFILAQEYLSGGALIDTLPEHGCTITVGLSYIAQMASALYYMHSRDVAHCDVKPDNIVHSDDALKTVKLIDFGAATYIGGPMRESSLGGTVHYLAPELIRAVRPDPVSQGLGPIRNVPAGSDPVSCAERLRAVDLKAVDVFALGVVLFALLTGEFPWEVANNACQQYRDYQRGLVHPGSPWSRLQPTAIRLLDRMLCEDTSQRYQMHHIWEYATRECAQAVRAGDTSISLNPEVWSVLNGGLPRPIKESISLSIIITGLNGFGQAQRVVLSLDGSSNRAGESGRNVGSARERNDRYEGERDEFGRPQRQSGGFSNEQRR